MQKFASNVQDKLGRAVGGASVTVLDADGNLAAIFIGNNSRAHTNPIVTDIDGEYAFYAANGRYSITVSAPGFIGESVSDVLLYDPAEPYSPIDATIADSAASAFANAQAAAASAATAESHKDQTAIDKAVTGADRTQTGIDRAATAADRAQTDSDKASTSNDRTAVAADRAQADLDAAATAADRAQTSADRATTVANAATATSKAAEAATSASNAASSEASALASKNAAGISASNAAASEGNALASKEAAALSAANAAESAALIDPENIVHIADLAAAAGPSLIGFNPAVNYVRGTLGYESSIAPSINSFDGVDPTGATDSAAAINAAIVTASTLGFKRLRFSGTYKCLSEITLGNCLAYEADPGTTINFDVPEFGLRIPNAGHDIEISGFTLTGSAARMIGVATFGMCSRIRIYDNDISGATRKGVGYTSGIFLDGASDCWIERNYLHGNGYGPTPDFCADIGLYISGNSRCHITENNCTSTTAGFGIICYDLKHSTISKNSVSGMVTASSNNNGYGICIYDNWSYTHTESGSIFNTVSGNVVTDTGGSGIYIVSASHNTITGNTCKSNALTQADGTLPAGGIVVNGPYANSNTVNGNTVVSSGKNGIVLSTCSYSTISGNSIASCLGYGINLRGLNFVNAITGNSLVANAGNIYGDSAVHNYLTITGNTLNVSTGTSSGIQFDTLSHSTVLGNLVANSGGHGIYIGGGTGNTVNSNTAIDNSANASNVYDGISVGSAETSINDNTSRNSGATGQRYGINNDGGGNSILNNRLSGNVTREINDPYGASKRGNKFSPGLSEGISAPMVAGSITISTPEVRTGDIILLTPTATGGAAGALTARNIINGTSFVIDSSSGTDTRPIAWEILH